MTKHDAPPSDVVSSTSGSSEARHGEEQAAGAHNAAVPYPNKTLGVVHPNGKMVWVPYSEQWTTLDLLKQDVAKAWQLEDGDFQIARSTPLLGDALIDHQCMEGEILYMLPKVNRTGASMAQMSERTQHNAPPTFTSSTGHAAHGGWYQLPMEEKIVHASINLLKIVNNSKQCTELQSNLELAVGMNVDCSPVFMKVSTHLPELIIHPAGNYLVAKCFDYHPALVDQATELICADVRSYAVHKHASYLMEAILTHPKGSNYSKSYLINEIFTPHNRVDIATHDSGNFVIQKAIEVCPDELMPLVMEGVQAVSLLTPHGAKMQKKVQSRLARAPQMNTAAQQQQQAPQQPMEYGVPEFHDPYDPSYNVPPTHGQQAPTTPATVQYNPYGDYSVYPCYDVHRCQVPVVQKPYPASHSAASVPASTTPTSTEEELIANNNNMPPLSWADDNTDFM
eukprot:TRINITY_DN1204_c13_g1_i1.p1 TRINITY_DN1204_c13_g1~~TRINITY_DN1204_c13_g1_i1.p1  ORF type:complete len:468 (+),score=145.19 TRINITY_DN1204_c13_g1_i1:49-1404(+)